MTQYVWGCSLLPCPYQTVCCKLCHSLIIYPLALDDGDIAALALLDLSAAFDTVDHDILLGRLHSSFGLNDTVLSWFCSYLSQRRQNVCHRGESSVPSVVQYGVPQGSVLGSILFVMYTADVVSIHRRLVYYVGCQ